MLNPDDFRFPSIEALQAFEAAARLGTFERAAELLSITGSAASKRVSSWRGSKVTSKSSAIVIRRHRPAA